MTERVRIESLDILRGFVLLGILTMNVGSMALIWIAQILAHLPVPEAPAMIGLRQNQGGWAGRVCCGYWSSRLR